MSANFPVMKLACCEEQIFGQLEEFHAGLSSGAAVFRDPRKRVNPKDELPQIPLSFLQQLLPTPKFQPRWNIKWKNDFLEDLCTNMENMYERYGGKWSAVAKQMSQRMARQVVWEFTMTQLGFPCPTDSKDDYVVAKKPDALVPKKEFETLMPKTGFEVPFIDWAAMTESLEKYGGDNYVDKKLITFVLDNQGALLKTGTKQNQVPDVGALKKPDNLLFHNFLKAVKAFLFEPVVVQSKTMGGSGAAPTAAAGFSEPLEHDFIEFKRSFQGIELCALPADGGPEQSDTEEDNQPLGTAAPSFMYNFESVVVGPAVKVLLFNEDVFKNPLERWTDRFKEKAGEFSRRLTLGFADPPWGLNRDSNKYGGIDLVGERWGRYVASGTAFNTF